MNKLYYQKEYILDNKEVDTSLPSCKLSDIDSLKYFFQKSKKLLKNLNLLNSINFIYMKRIK